MINSLREEEEYSNSLSERITKIPKILLQLKLSCNLKHIEMMRIWKWLKSNLSNAEFIKGAGSAFNLAGDYYSFKISRDPFMSDKKAIMSDWRAVGHDLKKSLDELESGKMLNNYK
ncbi:MAG: hypothetical protein MI921_27005 [Cytophagales bacterium]|nr:hypothetical protein [Cytophagales bacterium]